MAPGIALKGQGSRVLINTYPNAAWEFAGNMQCQVRVGPLRVAIIIAIGGSNSATMGGGNQGNRLKQECHTGMLRNRIMVSLLHERGQGRELQGGGGFFNMAHRKKSSFGKRTTLYGKAASRCGGPRGQNSGSIDNPCEECVR